MNKSRKHVFIISILCLLMVGVIGTASAGDWRGTADQFLANLTDNITSNSIVTITESNATVSTEYTISQSNITIKADGKVTFKGNSNSRLFTINAGNVKLQGVTFENFNTNNADGGVILWSGMYGTIENCTFTNNTIHQERSGTGGAIYWSGMYGTIENCTFKDNAADYKGGAIYWKGTTGTVSNCKFYNNTAESKDDDCKGGAIYISDNVDNWTQINCTFTSNTADDKGGAIYISDNVDNWTQINCTFTSNTADNDGGAIYIDSSINNWTQTNCTFTSNKAMKNDGGAICIDSSINNWTQTNCNFENNTAKDDGGAIYAKDTINWIQTNCTFTSNTANGDYGGAIRTRVTKTWIQTNCNFENNTVKTKDGGAICARDTTNNWIQTNCTFKENIANLNGGAIYTNKPVKNWTQTNCNFENNTASYGGAITTEDTVNNWTQDNCNFSQNTDQYGADIYNKGTITISGNSKALIYNNGIITNPFTVIILGNKTIKVDNHDNINLTAFIQTGNYTIIGSQDFNFTINNTQNIPANLTEDHYTAQYTVMMAVGDEILVNGSYAHTGLINYETALLIIKNEVFLSGENITLPYNKKIEIKLNATTFNGVLVENGTVSIIINGNTYSGNVSNGKVTIQINDKIDSGIYHLTAIYEENDDYSAGTFDFILNVTQIESMVNISVDSVIYGEQAIIRITTVSGMTGNLTLVVNDNPHSVSTDSKEFIITDLLDAGSYSVYAYYLGDRNFKSSENRTFFTVKPIATRTNVNVESVSGGIIIYINTTTINGKPAKGYVIVLVNDSYTYSTLVKNGIGKLSINDLPTGKYNAVVIFNSSGNYGVSYDNCSFDITSTPTSHNLTATNVYKEFENATQYYAVLKDNNGNPLFNRTISIAISSSKWSKDAYYRITTDKNGIATLTINLLPSNYIIRADYGDEISINNITVIPSNLNLKADNLVKYFKNGTQYTVKVTDVNNNPVANRTVTITINKASWKNPVKYYAQTNAYGIATLDINLIAGTYSITSNICYNSTKTTITVLPTLTANNIVKKVNKDADLKAKLVDGQGKAAKDKTITFTVKDKVYTTLTNSEGVAILPIHLGIGTWSILIADVETGAQTRATVKVTR